MATPKNGRQQPPRVFKNYTLVRVSAPHVGLTDIPDSAMTPLNVANTKGAPYYALVAIGFDFSFNGITYKSCVPHQFGCLMLADPVDSASADDVIAHLFTDSNVYGDSILTSIAYDDALLAPWLEEQYSTTDIPDASFIGYNDRMKYGMATAYQSYSQVNCGLRMYVDEHSSKGRRTIFRWTSMPAEWDSFLAPNVYVFRFECILYESGRIEYRYDSRKNTGLGPAAAEMSNAKGAIGSWASGSYTFRDFSLGLGYDDDKRSEYTYGGMSYSSYVDGAIPWAYNLTARRHWPAPYEHGAMYVFEPPKMRRRVLPRIEQRIVDSRLTYPHTSRALVPQHQRVTSQVFDDRRTVPFITQSIVASIITGSVVNYPTAMRRFQGGTSHGVAERQDLFTGDLELTGGIVKSACDDWMNAPDPIQTLPWSEALIHDGDDPFFSGSLIEEVGLGFSSPLHSKTQLRMSFGINTSTQMLSASSCIYYFNTKAGMWEIPQNSISSSYKQPIDASNSDIGDPLFDSPYGRVLEDYRGFGPIGNFVCSGGIDRGTDVGKQSDTIIGSSITRDLLVNALTSELTNSITVNEDYRATSDEVFSIPIEKPFLLEKAVFNFPMAAGPGWFWDYTTTYITSEGIWEQSFDFGGPGLTIALFNQRTMGDGTTIRDLIMTGTITHKYDDCSFFNVRDTQLKQMGFRAYGSSPSTIIHPTNILTGPGGEEEPQYLLTSSYTGSINVQCTSQVTNNIFVRLYKRCELPDDLFSYFNKEKLNVYEVGTTELRGLHTSSYVSSFGRNKCGLNATLRSQFCKEFATPQNLNEGGNVPNPFYVSGGMGLIDQWNYWSYISSYFTGSSTYPSSSLKLTGNDSIAVSTIIQLNNTQESPYLILPGDKLVLALAKARPFCMGSNYSPRPSVSSSLSHDIQLMTGTLNVTLYGSMVREGKEFHEQLTQPFETNSIHVAIGDEPVLDQIEPDYKQLFISGSNDDHHVQFVLTSEKEGTIDGGFWGDSALYDAIKAKQTITDWVSGRKFSNVRPNDTLKSLTYRYNDIRRNEKNLYSDYYKSYNTCKTNVRYVQCNNNVERFWDSMMPSVDECFKIDNMSIMRIGSTGSFIAGGLGSLLYTNGFAIFDCAHSDSSVTTGSINNNWTKSYPFEPHYGTAARQEKIEKSFISHLFIPSGSLTCSVTTPIPISAFTCGPVGKPWLRSATYSYFNFLYDYWGGGGERVLYKTISPTVNDLTKVLYGFGDFNNMIVSGGLTYGTNHFADTMLYTDEYWFIDENHHTTYGLGPIIRGWKYGVYSGLPFYSKAVFRRSSYGQMRDMLEQRPYTKFYVIPDEEGAKKSVRVGPVTVQFVTQDGKVTKPENTWSQNLSTEATSSFPYLDGVARNRTDPVGSVLNSSVVNFTFDQFGQLTV
jgi:hypothetical protein